MTTPLSKKVEAEIRMRNLLADADLPQPDEIEYGFTCIRLFWHDTKTCVVIDLAEYPMHDDGAADAA